MSYWIFPFALESSLACASFEASELILPAQGLADLARAQEPGQIAQWLRQLRPDATPEHIASQAQHYWRLAHELLPEDTLVVRLQENGSYKIGEITGPYFRDSRSLGMAHIWPVAWREGEVTANLLPQLAHYNHAQALSEIKEEDALQALKHYIPKLKKSNAALFRWIAITTLLFELAYFWPRGS